MTKIEISHKTVFFIAAFVFLLWIIIQIRDILFLLFVSFVFMAGLRPTVDWLEKIKIPRPLAIIFTYIVLFAVFGVLSSLLVPPLVTETVRFATQFATHASTLIPFIDIQAQDILPQIGPLGQNILRVTVGVFSNVITLFTLIIFTFYLLLERKHLSQFLTTLVGEQTGTRLRKAIIRIEYRLGAWIRGQLALMLIIGVVVYIGLTVLRIPFALPLAIIAGLLEVVPNIGPIFSAIPAVIIAITISSSPLLSLAVAAFYFIVQQIENSVIVPMIMRRAVGLPPLITIVSLLVGGRLAGVVGVLFAVPFVLVVQTLVNELWLGEKPKHS